MFVDTHSHLNFKAFENDYDGVIKRAFEAGVNKIVIPSSSLENSKKAIEIAEKYEGVYAAIGLHPIHVKDETFNEKEYLKLAKNKKVVAIGETGLDYYHDRSTEELQRDVFLKHIRVANMAGKPLIVHSREAAEDIVSILMGQAPLPRGVMHCFSENWQFARVVLDLGFFLSFTGIITFSKNYDNLEVIKQIPFDRLMIETDSPYLTPEPHRGQRNEPAYVIEVARKIAELRKVTLEEVANQTMKNANELFKLNL